MDDECDNETTTEFVVAGAEEVSTVTMDTPPKRIQRDSHCRADRFLLSIKTENNAVVKILSWYNTWTHARMKGLVIKTAHTSMHTHTHTPVLYLVLPLPELAT